MFPYRQSIHVSPVSIIFMNDISIYRCILTSVKEIYSIDKILGTKRELIKKENFHSYK